MRLYELRPGADKASVLTPTERPIPEPGPGEIQVRVRAVSLNYRDLAIASNLMPTPRVPLSDGAGEVTAIGPGVTRFAIGDRVAGTFFQRWDAGEITAKDHDYALGGSIDGMMAEYVVLREYGAVAIPSHFSFEEASTLPCAALTAWNSLFETGSLCAGQAVLLLGTGGVSIFGLQFARMHGARVILTSSSDAKLERARAEFGVDETINYRTDPDWQKGVWALTGNTGVDQVLEVGGTGTLEKSLQSTRYAGTVSLIGVWTGFGGTVNPMTILTRSIRVQGIYVGSRVMFERMNRAITQTGLRPVIDRVFPFEEASAAYDHMRSGAHFGKVVISMGGAPA